MKIKSASELLIQAECYRILALFYIKPQSGVHNNKKMHDLVVKSAELLNPKALEVSKKLRVTGIHQNIGDLSTEYFRLFENPGKVLAYPCSKHYISKFRSDSDSDLINWLTNIYQMAGYIPEKANEPIDHISTELNYIYHLLIHTAKGFKEDNMSAIDLYDGLHCKFVKEHIMKWLPEFTRCIINNSQSPYYLQLSILTRTVIVHCPKDDA